MPLNIQDSEDQKAPAPQKPDLPETPPAPGGGNRSLLLWTFVIVVLASAVFLLFQFGVIPTGGKKGGVPTQAEQVKPAEPPGAEHPTTPPGAGPAPSPTGKAGSSAPPPPKGEQAGRTDVGTRPPATAAAKPAVAVPPGRKPDSEKAADLRQRLSDMEGEYTIIISAFSSDADARELAGRWERAGYQAFVQHSGGWYKVALGRYATASLAREGAEKIRQALEEGYWIGRADR